MRENTFNAAADQRIRQVRLVNDEGDMMPVKIAHDPDDKVTDVI
jgi:hypothetical protein